MKNILNEPDPAMQVIADRSETLRLLGFSEEDVNQFWSVFVRMNVDRLLALDFCRRMQPILKTDLQYCDRLMIEDSPHLQDVQRLEDELGPFLVGIAKESKIYQDLVIANRAAGLNGSVTGLADCHENGNGHGSVPANHVITCQHPADSLQRF